MACTSCGGSRPAPSGTRQSYTPSKPTNGQRQSTRSSSSPSSGRATNFGTPKVRFSGRK